MACIVTVTTNNGNKVEVEVPSLPNSLSELKTILSSSGKLEELQTYIKQAVGSGNTIKNIKLQDIKNTSAIIPNTTVSLLRERFPDAGFPEIDLDNIPILYLNQYITQDSELQFGLFEQNGQQIFVIDNNEYHIKKFAAYLALRNAIENDNFLNKVSKEDKQILLECQKASNYSSQDQMVLEYLNNKNLFRTFRTSDGKSVFSLLNELLYRISADTRKRNFKSEEIAKQINNGIRKTNFNNTTANEFYQRLEKIDQKTWKIGLQEFYDQVLKYDDEIKLVIPQTFAEFKKFIKSETTPENFSNLIGETSNKLEALINFIVAKEPWLNMSYLKTSKENIIVENEFPSISKVYGIGFDTISKMTVQRYRGQYIYSDGKSFFPSEWMLSENTRSLAYNTLQEAKQSIDNSILKSNLNDYNFQRIYQNEEGRRILNRKIPAKTIIELKDYSLKFDYISNPTEKELVEVGTMDDFYKYIAQFDKTGEIVQNIQNAQEAVLFLYKKNELKNPNLIELAKEIHNSPSKYYYVEESYTDSQDRKYHRLLPAKDITIEEVKENYKVPVISLFNAISNLFSKKFNIQVEVLNNDEIKEQYKIEDAKAFILGDKIILNSTLASSSDIFHEYAHLVLGYLKYKNPENYRNLLQLVWSNMYSGNRNRIEIKYKTLPKEARQEEAFVSEFGNYISNNLLNENLQNIFKESQDFITEGVSSIFDGEINIYKIFGSTLNSVFRRFNSEIGHLLNSDDDFLSFIKSNDFFMQRKKINWLEKQIRLEKIKEKC